MTGDWIVRDTEDGKEVPADDRADAERRKADMEALGVDVEIVPPDAATDGGATEAVTPEVVDEDDGTVDEAVEVAADELPDRTVGENPLEWMPGDFIDEIDGSPAINRKGFAVLAYFYDVETESEIVVPPEETDFTFCRVKAVAQMPDGRRCEAHGSAHVDRDDDHYLLLELADTRAKKRALLEATGVGACAVEELKNEVSGDE